jgi:hypothetical protein
LEKNKLLLLPFFVGLVLMIISWYKSYPLATNSVNDRIFNHVSPLYWFGLPLLLTSMFIIALTSKNIYLKWIMTVGIVVTMYSMSYFYFPFSSRGIDDSQYVRGLNEFLAQTHNLSYLTSGKVYFQWPSSFVFTDIAASITGIQVANFDYLGFMILAFLISTSVYVYASRFFKNEGFLLVIAFFIGMYYYLDFEYEAFTFAFSLLLLLLVLDARQKNSGLILMMLLFFVSLVFTHLFVPVFFLIYLFARWIISRNKHHGLLFLTCSIIYFLVETIYSKNGFFSSILNVSRLRSQLAFASPVSLTIKQVYFPIDAIAQNFSTTVLILTVVLCVAGFFFLLVKRKLRDIDKAILLTGIVYTIPGYFVYLLGYRALALAFLPVCLGAPFIFQTRFKKLLIGLLLILLILFTFVPIHLAFSQQYITYQTKEGYIADNFFIDHYELSKPYYVLASFFTRDYLENRMIGPSNFTTDGGQIKEVKMVMYNLALQVYFQGSNNTFETIVYGEKLNTVYDNGFSKILMKSYNSK